MATGPLAHSIPLADRAIDVRGLVKRYGDLEAVRGIDLEVRRGEIFGFLGPNGAGKTTTIQILCTLLRATAGEAFVAGFDVRRQPDAVRAKIGLVFQDPSLDDHLTARENLHFHALIYDMPRAGRRRRIDDALTLVGLLDRAESQVRTFSGGMKRRLEIARGVLHVPDVLFLDEPTLGLDPQTRASIWNHVEALRLRDGLTVFVTTHYMEEAEHCDRLAIIDHGAVVAQGTPAELKALVGTDVVVVRANDPAACTTELEAKLGVRAVMEGDELLIEVRDAARSLAGLIGAISTDVHSVVVRRPTLEDVFLQLTGRKIRDQQASAVDGERTAVRRNRTR